MAVLRNPPYHNVYVVEVLGRQEYASAVRDIHVYGIGGVLCATGISVYAMALSNASICKIIAAIYLLTYIPSRSSARSPTSRVETTAQLTYSWACAASSVTSAP